ncbi:MAG: hydrolase [Alphaproteobacteria bacterium]|nr:hydrolase [Alphaproteobacteria bacterium]
MSDLVARARAQRDAILRHRDEMTAARRMPDALASALAPDGFFRMAAPKAYGGLETPPLEMFETIEALAETDASAAWCVMIAATTSVLGAYLPESEARSVFADPLSIATGVYAPMGKAELDGDSYVVSGRWKWNSGGQVSHWLCGGCVLFENGAPQPGADGAPSHRMMLFPAHEAEFIDTWRTSGLKGTGSGDMAVARIRVPRGRSVSLVDDAPRVNAPLYAFPVFGLLSIGIAAVASGNARGALDEFAAAAASKKLPGGRTLASRGAVQGAYAGAYAEVAAARALLLQEIDAAQRAASAGAALDATQRARVRLAATHLTRTAAHNVRVVQDLAGGGSVFLDDPLNRRLVDAQTMTAHMMVAPATMELTGRALLGLTVGTSEL